MTKYVFLMGLDYLSSVRTYNTYVRVLFYKTAIVDCPFVAFCASTSHAQHHSHLDFFPEPNRTELRNYSIFLSLKIKVKIIVCDVNK